MIHIHYCNLWCVHAPSIWNSLPANVRSSATLSTFRRHLKSHLLVQLPYCLATHLSASDSLRPWRYTNLLTYLLSVVPAVIGRILGVGTNFCRNVWGGRNLCPRVALYLLRCHGSGYSQWSSWLFVTVGLVVWLSHGMSSWICNVTWSET